MHKTTWYTEDRNLKSDDVFVNSTMTVIIIGIRASTSSSSASIILLSLVTTVFDKKRVGTVGQCFLVHRHIASRQIIIGANESERDSDYITRSSHHCHKHVIISYCIHRHHHNCPTINDFDACMYRDLHSRQTAKRRRVHLWWDVAHPHVSSPT